MHVMYYVCCLVDSFFVVKIAFEQQVLLGLQACLRTAQKGGNVCVHIYIYI